MFKNHIPRRSFMIICEEKTKEGFVIPVPTDLSPLTKEKEREKATSLDEHTKTPTSENAHKSKREKHWELDNSSGSIWSWTRLLNDVSKPFKQCIQHVYDTNTTTMFIRI